MAFYSEKTQRQADKYFKQLVRRQPSWLRDLFDEDKVVFIVDDGGILSLHVDEALDTKTKNNAAALVSKYLSKHPIGVLKTIEVN